MIHSFSGFHLEISLKGGKSQMQPALKGQCVGLMCCAHQLARGIWGHAPKNFLLDSEITPG